MAETARAYFQSTLLRKTALLINQAARALHPGTVRNRSFLVLLGGALWVQAVVCGSLHA